MIDDITRARRARDLRVAGGLARVIIRERRRLGRELTLAELAAVAPEVPDRLARLTLDGRPVFIDGR